MEELNKRKNILDLEFQKNLVIASTSVIIAFTYLIGVGIAIFTEQIKLDDFVDMSLLLAVSAVVLGLCIIFLFNSRFHLKNIISAIKDL